MRTRRGAAAPAVRRRTVLSGGAAAAGALALGACSLNNPYNEDATPPEEAIERLDPDIALAVEAVAALGVAQRLVEATGRRHPKLAAELQGLLALHRAHHAALVEAVPDDVDLTAGTQPAQVAPRPDVARQRVVAAEDTLRNQLRGFALRAQSGPFARLLASMTAAVAQQRAVQPAGGQA